MKSAAFLMFMTLTAGCASPELDVIERDIDQLEALQVKAPERQSGPVGWPDLIESAKVRGPQFMQNDIEALRAGLDLDARKAGRLPRISIGLRARGNAAGPDLAGSASLGLNYDLASAVIAFDPESIAFSEQLIPLQHDLRDRQAEVSLLETLGTYLAGRDRVEKAKLDLQLGSCERQQRETEISLGTAAPNSLELLDTASSRSRSALGIYQEELDALRSQTLWQAGISREARIATQIKPPQGRPGGQFSTAQCRIGAGIHRRDELLLGLAKRALEQAQLSRFTQLSAILPTQLDPTSGLDLDLLISWIVPIIDQGDVQRTVQRARLDLLAIAVQARNDRVSFEQNLSDRRIALAALRSRLAELEATEVDRDEELAAAERCRQDVQRSLRMQELKRLREQISIVLLQLHAICASR